MKLIKATYKDERLLDDMLSLYYQEVKEFYGDKLLISTAKDVLADANVYWIENLTFKKVGFVSYSHISDGIVINKIYVDEEYRHRLFGFAVLKFLTHQYQKVLAVVHEDNKKAIKLFSKLSTRTENKKKQILFHCYQMRVVSKLNKLREQYNDDLLYVGLRGSRAIDNMWTQESDYDYYIVVKNHARTAKEQQDDFIISLENFKKTADLVSFETVEALTNTIYCSDEFKELFANYYTWFNSRNENVETLFRFQLFQMLKNQLKQHDKSEGARKSKFAAKSWLYYTILTREDKALYHWLERNLDEYLHEYNLYKLGYKEVEIIDEIRDYRLSNDNRREWFIKKEDALREMRDRKF